MLTIRDAGLQDITLIQELTYKIWPETYGAILSAEQISYMLDMMYNTETLTRQLNGEQTFFLCYDDDKAVGFSAFGEKKDHIWHLHKIYILPGQQGKGIGRFLIEKITTAIKPLGAAALQLNVNRYNKARDFYERLGFTILREEDIDIGNGYFMNDYIMELKLT
jgi:ribosomal protein S18 acetylase RimI-like enzyme